MEWVAALLFGVVILVLLAGFPVALSLGGTALIFAGLGVLGGSFNEALLFGLPNRLFGIMTNEMLVAVPLFVFMGVTLERARIAEDLLETMSALLGSLRGGLGISVTLIGMLLAASTGIVGATVVTMGLLSLPTMLRRGYSPEISSGIICASGTLGQIIPPSIVLVMLGDVMTTAYQQAQLEMGILSPRTVSVGDLFAGAGKLRRCLFRSLEQIRGAADFSVMAIRPDRALVDQHHHARHHPGLPRTGGRHRDKQHLLGREPVRRRRVRRRWREPGRDS